MSDRRPACDGRVDVVIATYENQSLIRGCLDGLRYPRPAQVIVVDDVSTDETLSVIKQIAPEATVIALNEHRGLSHALNQGAGAGCAPYVLFINDDVVAARGAIARLADHLDHRPDLVFAAGRLVDPETGQTQARYKPRSLPSAAALIARLTGVERHWRSNPWSGQHLRDALPEDGASEIRLQPAGACVMVRRTVLEEIGGWDEDFWFWYEDVDLAARLLRCGVGVWDPLATFRHLGRHSTRSWDKPMQHARLYNSTLRYAYKHLSRRGRIVVAGVSAAATLVRVPLYLARRRATAALIYLDLTGQAVAVARGLPPGAPSDLAVHRRTRGSAMDAHPTTWSVP